MQDNNVFGDLILALEQLEREWEELGSGAGPEDDKLQHENMRLRLEKRGLLRLINQLARDKNQLRQEKGRLARQK